MKFLLFGCGYWGKKIATILREKGELVTFDPSFTNERNEKELLIDHEITHVFIASPEETHYKLAQLSIEYQKPVFVEKPLCLYESQAKELILLGQKKNTQLFVDYIFLYDSCVEKIHSLLQMKVIGKIQKIESIRFSTNIIKPHIQVTDDLAIHDIYLLKYLFKGSFDSIQIDQCLLRNNQCVEAKICYQMNEIEIISHYSWVKENKQRSLKILGEHGEIHWATDNSIYLKKFGENITQVYQASNYQKISTLQKSIESFLHNDRTQSNYLNDIAVLEKIRNIVTHN